MRAINQVQNILQWDSPESVSKLNGDSLKGKRYDVILYHEPPFVIWEDREGTADPVSFQVGDLHECEIMLQEERPAAGLHSERPAASLHPSERTLVVDAWGAAD